MKFDLLQSSSRHTKHIVLFFKLDLILYFTSLVKERSETTKQVATSKQVRALIKPPSRGNNAFLLPVPYYKNLSPVQNTLPFPHLDYSSTAEAFSRSISMPPQKRENTKTNNTPPSVPHSTRFLFQQPRKASSNYSPRNLTCAAPTPHPRNLRMSRKAIQNLPHGWDRPLHQKQQLQGHQELSL